jgi:hypothetical protein
LLTIKVGKSPVWGIFIGVFLILKMTKESSKIREALSSDKASLIRSAGPYKELLMVLKIFPIFGPSMRRIAITTIATNTRMIAYSTNPCPLSCGCNNMDEFLSE